MHSEDLKDLEVNLKKQCDSLVSDTKEENKETCEKKVYDAEQSLKD
jgi:hypothetical protein